MTTPLVLRTSATLPASVHEALTRAYSPIRHQVLPAAMSAAP